MSVYLPDEDDVIGPDGSYTECSREDGSNGTDPMTLADRDRADIEMEIAGVFLAAHEPCAVPGAPDVLRCPRCRTRYPCPRVRWSLEVTKKWGTSRSREQPMLRVRAEVLAHGD